MSSTIAEPVAESGSWRPAAGRCAGAGALRRRRAPAVAQRGQATGDERHREAARPSGPGGACSTPQRQTFGDLLLQTADIPLGRRLGVAAGAEGVGPLLVAELRRAGGKSTATSATVMSLKSAVQPAVVELAPRPLLDADDERRLSNTSTSSRGASDRRPVRPKVWPRSRATYHVARALDRPVERCRRMLLSGLRSELPSITCSTSRPGQRLRADERVVGVGPRPVLSGRGRPGFSSRNRATGCGLGPPAPSAAHRSSV